MKTWPAAWRVMAAAGAWLVLVAGCGSSSGGGPKDAGGNDLGASGGAAGETDAAGSGGATVDAPSADGGDDGPPAVCVTAVECPGDDGECNHRTCIDGVCGIGSDPQGKVLANQTAGDCQVRKCDGLGVAVVSADDADLPDDQNPCTKDICAGGVASHQAQPLGTSCGGTQTCSADGQCTGCTVATDCPGTDNECRTRTCTQGTCGFSFKAAGIVVTDPTAGDCKGLQCDGLGVAQVADAPGDVPSDDNPCTLDRCNGGTPTFGPAPRGTACGDGKVCDGQAHCASCLSAATCPGTDDDCKARTCTAGVCGFAYSAAGKALTTQAAGDCKKAVCDGQGATMSVDDDTDVPADNNPCTDDVCTAGAPSNPPKPVNTVCNGSLKCDGAGHCGGCTSAAECGTDTMCVTFSCTSGQCGSTKLPPGSAVGTQVPHDCRRYQCDAAGAVISVADDSDLPVDGTVCTGDVCSNGTPSNPPVASGTACSEGGGTRCNSAGACVECNSAANCGTDTECKKFTCSAQGVCGRNDPASGTALGAQTAGDCKKTVCDGSGGTTTITDDTDKDDGNACTNDQCSGGTATHTSVAAGKTCNQGGGVQCDGAGTCGPAIVKINEVESSGGVPGDWVELYNTSASVTMDISGWIFKDSDDTHTYTIPAGKTIAPHGFLVLEEADFGFGLGSSDAARLFDASGTVVIDSYTWPSHAAVTYGRCPLDGTGTFVNTLASTKGAPNSCPAN